MTYEGRAGVLLARALADIVRERRRQDAKWGFVDLPDGTGSEDSIRLAMLIKQTVDRLTEAGTVTWGDILVEEMAEVLAERDRDRLRDELVQLGALTVKWVQWLDLRKDKQEGRHAILR